MGLLCRFGWTVDRALTISSIELAPSWITLRLFITLIGQGRSAGALPVLKRGWQAMRQLLLSILSVATASAAQPKCNTLEKADGTVVACERAADVAECRRFIQETPSIARNPNWNDCIWPAMLYKSYTSASGQPVVTLSVSVVPSFRDSRAVDLVVTVNRHGQAFQLIRKDVEVKIDANNIPSATADFALGLVDELDRVPTVDMTEKGGQREMSHGYH